MQQQSIAKFASEDGKIQLLCDSDTALGTLHDYLMVIKGNIVDRMVKAQKEEVEISGKIKEKEKELMKESESGESNGS